MFDFGEELTIESYRIPWLIWIQVLVMFLLIFLLYCFSISALDLSGNNTTNPASSSSSSPSPSSGISMSNDSHLDNPILNHNTTVTSCFQVGSSQSIKGEIATSRSRRIVREDSRERDSSIKDATPMNFHLCHIMRVAKIAFLKCLGLDSSPENSPTPEHRKRS